MKRKPWPPTTLVRIVRSANGEREKRARGCQRGFRAWPVVGGVLERFKFRSERREGGRRRDTWIHSADGDERIPEYWSTRWPTGAAWTEARRSQAPDTSVPPDGGVTGQARTDATASPTALPSTTIDASPPASDVAPALPAPPDATPTDSIPPPPVTLRVLRAHDVKADRITAGLVYAHKLEAKTGTVGKLSDPLPDSVLAAEIGRDNVKAAQLTVDVLYAHDIRAGSVEITEARVGSLKIESAAEPGD